MALCVGCLMTAPLLLMASATGITPFAISNNTGLSMGSWSTTGATTTIPTVVPAAIGDILVLGVRTNSATATVSSISGGGVTTWHPLPFSAGSGISAFIYYGVVTSTTSSSISLVMSTTVGSMSGNLLEFSTVGGTWALDGSGGTSSANAAGPSLTPSRSNELYIGFVGNTGDFISAGSTSGYVYIPGSGEAYSMFFYKLSVGPGTTQAPALIYAGGNNRSSAQLIAAIS